jgi:hypothetical protein
MMVAANGDANLNHRTPFNLIKYPYIINATQAVILLEKTFLFPRELS